MNADQWKTLLKASLIFVFGIAGGIGVTKGWYTAEQLTAFLNGPLVASVIGFATTLVISLLARTNVNLVNSAANLPGVTVVAPPAIANTGANATNPSVVSTTDATVVPK